MHVDQGAFIWLVRFPLTLHIVLNSSVQSLLVSLRSDQLASWCIRSQFIQYPESNRSNRTSSYHNQRFGLKQGNCLDHLRGPHSSSHAAQCKCQMAP